MIVLIPAYEPDDRLVELVAALGGAGCRVVVVDDGSGTAYGPVFDDAARLGATVLRHDANRGKGAALRTGFAAIRARHPGEDVVTADCDGQHLVADILAIAAVTAESRTAIVLGVRAFDGPDVPRRSRLGNHASRAAFALAAGQRLADTQTGLRGYPANLLDWLVGLPGDRFEYEFRMLLRARDAGWTIAEVPIATVYLERNAGSHFRPIADSVRVWAPFARFTLSALLAFAVDTIALLVLQAATGWLLGAVVGARLVSAGVNYTVNRAFVFRDRAQRVRSSLPQYAALAALLLAANYGTLSALTEAGVPLLPAKVLTEGLLFAVSFQVQRNLVFRASGAADGLDRPRSAQASGQASGASVAAGSPATTGRGVRPSAPASPSAASSASRS